MRYEIVSPTAGDISQLSAFLREGFNAEQGEYFADPDVLRWKYFDGEGVAETLIARDEGRIVGHIGWCLSTIVVGTQRVSTLHTIDWLGSSAHRTIGLVMMMQLMKRAQTQYAVGGSEQARTLERRAGYHRWAKVPRYERVLRPGSFLRETSGPAWKRPLKAARAVARNWLAREGALDAEISLERVSEFGDEIDEVTRAASAHAVFTARDKSLLNHALRFPAGEVTGWKILRHGTLRGFAVLSILSRDGFRTATIAECMLDATTTSLWHASIAALVRELERRAVDRVRCMATTPWMANAVLGAGFSFIDERELALRDPEGLVAIDKPVHVTHVEADFFYI